MPIIETRGSLSSQGYGQFARGSFPPAYIEDVFSTWLYNATNENQTITNGINFVTRGGLLWAKNRSVAANFCLLDTLRGSNSLLASSSGVPAVTTTSTTLSSFNSNGFSIGSNDNLNDSPNAFVSWSFARQQRFFDIVTYTGNNANRTIAHSLGSVPGCIMVKRLDTAGDWEVYHRSLGNTQYIVLNSSTLAATSIERWNNTTPTDSVFSLGPNANVNASGGTYVAYLFAHDAGGFGAAGTDNAISCGSYLGNDISSGPIVNLGWEPQWLLIKGNGDATNWLMIDNVRGLAVGGNDSVLEANSSGAETRNTRVTPTSTGFQISSNDKNINFGDVQYLYIAIRRGPMRTPTLGTSVFTPTVYTGTNVNNRLVNTTIAPDMVWIRQRGDNVLAGMVVGDRMRGQPYSLTGSVSAEVTSATAFDQQIVNLTEYGSAFASMNGVFVGTDPTAKLNVNTAFQNHIAEAFRRAPGFFDVVCYTGTGVARTVNHNLGVVPELMLVKIRGSVGNWQVYSSQLSNGQFLVLNTNSSATSGLDRWNSTTPTATVFTVGTSTLVNGSGSTYAAYLFASCPGVSKVGSYVGTGSTLEVDCGFTTGARFVLIKTISTGDWYIWDSARGINAGASEPYLVLNSTAAEVTGTNWVNTFASGFEVSNAAGNPVNGFGNTYAFLAIA